MKFDKPIKYELDIQSTTPILYNHSTQQLDDITYKSLNSQLGNRLFTLLIVNIYDQMRSKLYIYSSNYDEVQ